MNKDGFRAGVRRRFGPLCAEPGTDEATKRLAGGLRFGYNSPWGAGARPSRAHADSVDNNVEKAIVIPCSVNTIVIGEKPVHLRGIFLVIGRKTGAFMAFFACHDGEKDV